MSLLLKVCRSPKMGKIQKAMNSFSGVMKVGDFATDVFFVKELIDFNNIFVDNNAADATTSSVPVDQFVIASTAFLVVGVLFDLYKLCHYARQPKQGVAEKSATSKDAQEEQDEEMDEAKWERWEKLNFWFEEVPQFVILMLFFYFVWQHKNCVPNDIVADEQAGNVIGTDREELISSGCSEEMTNYSGKLAISAITSTLFTGFFILKEAVSVMWWCGCRKEPKTIPDAESKSGMETP